MKQFLQQYKALAIVLLLIIITVLYLAVRSERLNALVFVILIVACGYATRRRNK